MCSPVTCFETQRTWQTVNRQFGNCQQGQGVCGGGGRGVFIILLSPLFCRFVSFRRKKLDEKNRASRPWILVDPLARPRASCDGAHGRLSPLRGPQGLPGGTGDGLWQEGPERGCRDTGGGSARLHDSLASRDPQPSQHGPAE